MFQQIKKAKEGFTIIELLIVIAIIIALAMLVLNNFQGAQAKARDTQRVTDVNTLHSKLEEYYNDNSHYPSTFTADTFPGMDAGAMTDPTGGDSISINAAVADEDAANAVAAPASDTDGGASYLYVPYGCDGTSCTGYVLKTYIERPSGTTTNPYVKLGLNNN